MSTTQKHTAKPYAASKKAIRFADSRRNEIIFLLAVIIASLAFSFLISGYSRMRIPQYSVGDIARADVLVPVDVLVMDEQATRIQRTAARDAVPPVYRYRQTSQTALIVRVSEIFRICRQILDLSGVKGSHIYFRRLPRDVQLSIKQAVEPSGSELHDEMLDYLIQNHFSDALENQFLMIIKSAIPVFLMEDARSLAGAEQIQIVSDAGPDRVMPAGKITDLEHARRMLRASIDDGLKASGQIRRMISEWLGRMIAADLRFDLQATEARKSAAEDAVDPVLRQLKSGKIIIRQGDEISADQLKQLDAVRHLTPSLRSLPQFVGTNLLLIPLLAILGVFLRSSSIRQWNATKLLIFCLLTLLANLILLKLLWFVSESLSRNFVANPFSDSKLFFVALPFAFGSMLVTLLAGYRIALLLLIFYCPLALQITGSGLQDFLFIVSTNVIGILVVQKTRERMAIVGAGFKLSAAATGLFLAVQLAKGTPLDLGTGTFGSAMAFISGPITASLLTFAVPLCERAFSVTTEIRLSELGNLNLPLLKELIVRAPGTYSHSVAVGTLAQGVANAIGLDALFLRVSCLYHDIGKLLHPQIYIENQGEGENPHNVLTPLESVQRIRQHVTEGIRLGREAGLPPAVIDVIPQHHGTKLLSYFYDKAIQQAGTNSSQINKDDFRHLGPKPQTKEAAVVMLADSIEAAARTLTDHSQERLLLMIQKIIAAAMDDGQLTECDLTLSEIERITFSFLETLASFYHSRIDYPSFDFSSKGQPAKPGH